ncbi:hypothetical protein CY34DRAFT_109171 [Suillus luteus UH-Slu-Lm8-n1]|uniref:Uncharacterized protein n=1 Tax=Suillus luteus UH-Slu-Lm8-n1 TaxID=930992 RepID=A0A0D0ASM8_9AGAM|nr:hypothetical protein CY34DRAFT_109171 [Suillus luteus UH-Slu-Lm8-n1]
MKNTPYILHASEKLTEKPRLAYDFETLQLEVDMPLCVHNFAMNVIQRGLESMDRMMHDIITVQLIHSEVHPSLTLNTGKKEFVSNCIHIITARCNPPIKKIPSMIEVVFLQSDATLLDRFRNTVKFYPELGMIFMLVINEAPPYLSPKALGHTWRKLHLRGNKPFHLETAFLSLRDEPQSLDEPTPVIVKDHSWCMITDVQVQSLFPVYDKVSMKDMILLIMQELNLTKDCFIEQFCLVARDTMNAIDDSEEAEEYTGVTGKHTADVVEFDTPQANGGHQVYCFLPKDPNPPK